MTTVFDSLVKSKGLQPGSAEYEGIRQAFEAAGMLEQSLEEIVPTVKNRRSKKPVTVLKQYIEESELENEQHYEKLLTIGIVHLLIKHTMQDNTDTHTGNPLSDELDDDFMNESQEDEDNVKVENPYFTLTDNTFVTQLTDTLEGMYDQLTPDQLIECYKHLNKGRRKRSTGKEEGADLVSETTNKKRTKTKTKKSNPLTS